MNGLHQPMVISLGSIVVCSATVSCSASVALCECRALVMVPLMVAERKSTAEQKRAVNAVKDGRNFCKWAMLKAYIQNMN